MSDSDQVALHDRLESYFQARRARVRPFVDRHFTLGGALRIHQQSFLADLFRHLVNVFWSIPALTLKKLILWLEGLGFDGAARLVRLIPSTLKTDFQKELEWLVYQEIFELPFRQGARELHANALWKEIEAAPALAKFLEKTEALAPYGAHPLPNYPGIRRHFGREVSHYLSRRSTMTDLFGIAVTLGLGSFLFHNQSLDPFQMGRKLAYQRAHHDAVSHFFLGKGLGSTFYGIVPVHASQHDVWLVTAIIIGILSLLTLIVGVISDPIFWLLGVHERQLNQLIDAVEARVLVSAQREFKKAGSRDCSAFKNSAEH